MTSHRQGKAKRPPLVRVFLGLLLAGGIAYAVFADATRPQRVETAEVREGAIAAWVEERAQTSLPRIYRVTMPLPGRILPVALREGDPVEKGQVVARLEDVDWKEAGISAAEMLSAMQSAVEASQAEVRASELRRDYTEWVKKALEDAEATGATSKRDQRQAEWQYLDAKVKEEESIASLHVMEAFLAMTKLLPGMVDRNFERTTLESPVDGVVLRRHVSNEKTMLPGDPVLDFGQMEQLYVTADVLTEEAVGIQAGDRVEIFGEAIGEVPIAGSVRRIRPEAFTKLSSLGVEQQRVTIEIDFDPDDRAALTAEGRSLGLNYRVRVRMITDERESSLLVPRTALFRNAAGAWEVFRVGADGRAEQVLLEIGLMNDFEAEVLSGLSVGDQVIVAPDANLDPGTRVEALP